MSGVILDLLALYQLERAMECLWLVSVEALRFEAARAATEEKLAEKNLKLKLTSVPFLHPF